MQVGRLEARDFRNWERVELELGSGLTVVCGPNGAGKTNLVEAAYFGLVGRSCRTSNEREMVRHGASTTRVVVTTSDAGVDHRLEAALEASRIKRLRLDGAEPDAPAAAAARPPVAVFAPDRLELVKGAPAHRRGHLDSFVTAIWPARADRRGAYARALAQRNALLGRVRSGAAAAGQLDAWDVQLASAGLELMSDRADAAERLRGPFASRALELGLPVDTEVRYRPRSLAQDVAELVTELAKRRPHDLERGFTTHGPHRDDLALVVGGRALRAYGSQGQQRLGVLALLFAERDVLAHRGRLPLMLLDDVMSELDRDRRSRLVELIRSGGQTVITATDPEHVPGARDPDVLLVEVEEGQLESSRRPVAA
jgi:DNA replication and repair protein RecF